MTAIRLVTDIPGPRSVAFMERRRRAVSAGISIGANQICAASAEGALVTDLDGNTFIDLTGGIGCLNVGHSQGSVVDAAQEQAAKLQHACFQVAMYEPYVELVEKLIAITPGDFEKKSCLFNSGAEAVENAVKIARAATGRQAIVCFDNGFHGRTLLGMSLTSKFQPYKAGFGPFAPEVYKITLPRGTAERQIAALQRFFKSTIAPKSVAAVIFEPVLGEGGFIVHDGEFVSALAKICRENGIILIADEIQTGFARTGKMFASEHFGIEPDIVTMAKSMSNGFPVSAVVGRAELMDAVQPGGLGGTFSGNPVACAAALATIDVIEKENLCERADRLGAIIRERLAELSSRTDRIGEIRGLGAMIAFEIVDASGDPDKKTADSINAECAKNGVLLLTAGLDGNVIRFLMPLTIPEAQLNEALDVLETCVMTCAGTS